MTKKYKSQSVRHIRARLYRADKMLKEEIYRDNQRVIILNSAKELRVRDEKIMERIKNGDTQKD